MFMRGDNQCYKNVNQTKNKAMTVTVIRLRGGNLFFYIKFAKKLAIK